MPDPTNGDETSELLHLHDNIEGALYEVGFFYAAGRHDGGDHTNGEGDWPSLYAKLMVATDGSCGLDIASLYHAWQNSTIEDYILKGAPTPEMLTAAMHAWQEWRDAD